MQIHGHKLLLCILYVFCMQARAHQLLLHNKDLLDHVSQLVNRLQTFEMKATGISSDSELIFQTPPQVGFYASNHMFFILNTL